MKKQKSSIKSSTKFSDFVDAKYPKIAKSTKINKEKHFVDGFVDPKVPVK